MLYLAWKTFKSSGDIEESHSSANFFSGLFLQFINAKIYIYCIVSMQVYILAILWRSTSSLFGFAILLATIGFYLLYYGQFLGLYLNYYFQSMQSLSIQLWPCCWYIVQYLCFYKIIKEPKGSLIISP